MRPSSDYYWDWIIPTLIVIAAAAFVSMAVHVALEMWGVVS